MPSHFLLQHIFYLSSIFLLYFNTFFKKYFLHSQILIINTPLHPKIVLGFSFL
ncbi:hypothetical protein HMPREF3206_01012 [Fusobacterium equinum]|uniref:Uncharacterized protein n=1 Tax=Fusobacterium equinum TaxID=134605 RepID=A0A133NDH4_9FUSO|nr:hypothetical protein HMPREF3206_01012 [Fusobacterium equinum]